MTHVKICGFQKSEHAFTAIEAGVDSIGLVFVEGASRSLGFQEAENLLERIRGSFAKLPEIVGLFADQPLDQVTNYIEKLKLDSIQLCANESMEYCSKISIPVYKVIGIDPQVPISAQMPRIMLLQQRHSLAGHRIVIDTKISGAYGGTGISFDWDVASDLSKSFRMTLAGGLSPDNVAQAITQVRPWGVDASSGVESNGEKDPEKIVTFIRQVKNTDLTHKNRSLFKLFRRN